MLQLATPSARGASETPDLLITRGRRAAPCAVLHFTEVVSDRPGGHRWVRNLDDRQLRRAYRRRLHDHQWTCSHPGGLWSELHSRWPCGL